MNEPTQVVSELSLDPGFLEATSKPDQSSVLLTYLQFLGDAAKTAVSVGLKPAEVQAMAMRFDWAPKVAALRELHKQGGAERLAIELNRVKCFVQAVKLRHVLDRILKRISNDGVDFDDFITNRTQWVQNFDMKKVAELAKACQIAQDLSYKALGDTCGERKPEENKEYSSQSLSIVKALAALGEEK